MRDEKYFADLADRFIDQVQAARIGPAADVAIVYHWEDDYGSTYPPQRESIVPKIGIRASGDQDAVREVALEWMTQTVIDNINSLVRHESGEPRPGRPGFPPARIARIDLEIIDPDPN